MKSVKSLLMLKKPLEVTKVLNVSKGLNRILALEVLPTKCDLVNSLKMCFLNPLTFIMFQGVKGVVHKENSYLH